MDHNSSQSLEGNALALKYFNGDVNAGDLASPYMLAAISGRPVRHLHMAQDADEIHYMCVGSTIRHADARTIVWGTGVMNPQYRLRAPPKIVIGVRGPLGSAALAAKGYGEFPAIGDGALSIPRFFSPAVEQKFAAGLIPHYVDLDDPFCDTFRETGGLVISPQQPLEPYLLSLLSCRVIASSSLHGLIFAHAYGLPAIWIELDDRVVGGGFKFQDHYAFMGVDVSDIPKWRPDQSISQNLARASCPSVPRISRAAPDMLREVLESNNHV